jgi:threonine dehydrogenase-like Zn-dependent dehydrogenase
MKALRFHAAKDLRFETIDSPGKKPLPGEVLIQAKAFIDCGIRGKSPRNW